MKNELPSIVSINAETLKQISQILDDCIEIITGHLVHGDVSNEGWKTQLQELVVIVHADWNKSL